MRNFNSVKNCFYLSVLSVFLLSCNDDNLSSDISSDVKTPANAKEHVCLDVYTPEDIALLQKSNSTPGTSTNAALLASKKWTNGQTVRIKFLNGTPFLQNKVRQFASEWLKYANLKFKYVSDAKGSSDIRINFDNSGSSWSAVGNDCNTFAYLFSTTMNFGWFTDSTPDSEFSRTVIHEFGHALGLVHEHQSPAAGIQWNKPKIYEYYAGAPNYWSKAQVDSNIFNKYSATVTNYSAFDNQSIMLYAFPASFTLDGWSSGWNTVLSPTDKSFITQQYPGKKTLPDTEYLYRYSINTQHFYTSDYSELGWRCYYEGILGEVYSTQVPDTYPIYRYYNTISKDHLSTLNLNELKNGGQDGWVYEGITGYAYNTPHPNTIPVYRYFKSGEKPDHFFTIDNTETSRSRYKYTYEGIAFYILK